MPDAAQTASTSPPDALAKSQLKARGWTDGAIKTFLGEPDRVKTNPHYRSGPPMQLYALTRVVEAEDLPAFREWHQQHQRKRTNLSRGARQAAQRKREQLLAYIERLNIQIPRLGDQQAVYRKAVKHYNALWSSRGNFDKHASVDDSPEFLNRIARNMLRHAFSDYEDEIDNLFGQVGREEGYALLRERVNAAISKTYPFLGE